MNQIQGFLNQIASVLGAYLPKAFGALLLLVAAWLIASIVRAVINRVGRAARLDERAGFTATKSASELGYWLIFLFFLPGVLEALGLQQLLVPIQGMVSKIFAFLPNLLAGGVIFAIGYFVAKLVSKILSSLVAAAGIDKLSTRFNLTSTLGNRKLSDMLGTVVFALIIVTVAQAALSALQLEVITRPIEAMMTKMISALPNIISAAVLMTVVVYLGRMVGNFFGNLLSGIGLDAMIGRLGIARFGEAPGATKVSGLIAWVVTAGIVLMGAMEAANLLGFGMLNTLIAQFSVFASQLVMGVVIFAIGLFLANLAADAIKGSGSAQAGLLSTVARGAVLVFAGSMALRQMGLAPEIVNVAFSLLLGALAVAFAVAFGLGGRESAGKVVAELLAKLKS